VQFVDVLTKDVNTVAAELWNLPSCCLSEHFDQKVRKLFPTPEACLEHRVFQAMLRNWCREFRAVNMHVERIFALMKCGVGPHQARARPDVERIVSAGTLCQWKAIHCKAGNAEPRWTTRAQLLRGGAPLACGVKKKCKTSNAKCGPFILFRNSKVTLRRARIGAIDKQAALREQHALKQTWAGLSAEVRETFNHRARAEHSRRELARMFSDDDVSSCVDKQPVLWGLNSQDYPLSVKTLEEVARRALELSDGDDLLGSRLLCENLRAALREGTFIADAGHLE
jgi:hypothetical protein